MKSGSAEFLLSFRRAVKLYDAMLKQACRDSGLSQLEATIISFLHNHPGRDTAGDIVELRMIPKSNVSQGVESLIQKSLLQRRQDETDRRRIHLSLTPEALPVVERIEETKQQFYQQLFLGFTPEEQSHLRAYHVRIAENTKNGLERIASL